MSKVFPTFEEFSKDDADKLIEQWGKLIKGRKTACFGAIGVYLLSQLFSIEGTTKFNIIIYVDGTSCIRDLKEVLFLDDELKILRFKEIGAFNIASETKQE